MMSSRKKLIRLVLSALFLALALVLPFLTGQIPQIGSALCPMHIPVLLCGFFCGPLYGLAVGLIAPLLRFLLFQMPPIFPTGLAMSFELAVYGLASGLFYQWLPKRRLSVYLSLLSAMLAGRIVWGIACVILYGLRGSPFGWTTFMAGAFLNAIPGIAIQILLIPVLVMTLTRIFPVLNPSPRIEK